MQMQPDSGQRRRNTGQSCGNPVLGYRSSLGGYRVHRFLPRLTSRRCLRQRIDSSDYIYSTRWLKGNLLVSATDGVYSSLHTNQNHVTFFPSLRTARRRSGFENCSITLFGERGDGEGGGATARCHTESGKYLSFPLFLCPYAIVNKAAKQPHAHAAGHLHRLLKTRTQQLLRSIGGNEHIAHLSCTF